MDGGDFGLWALWGKLRLCALQSYVKVFNISNIYY